MRFTSLCITEPDQLVFGQAPKPVECGHGLRIGSGAVFPEVNFTLPDIPADSARGGEVLRLYEETARAIVTRARALAAPGLVLEFEHLPPMTEEPTWGAEITRRLADILREAHDVFGMPCALRVTPVDVRHGTPHPRLRDGAHWESLQESFALCAEAGADMLSIESVGGKEVSDEALLHGDIEGIVLALGILAVRDMDWLWDAIVSISGAHTVVAAGDSACGFANTAMQLAGQKMLPESLAAVVRAMGAARSLVAFERGAVGPSKDCAYEGPVLKAITGAPVSMEGKSAACAHFSPVGNIAASMCDLWSNESVQPVPLLSGSAPEAFAEILVYDCRLMNKALQRGHQKLLRDLLVSSDEHLSPQALVMSPQATIVIASAIVSEPDRYRRTIKAGVAAATLVREAVNSSLLELPKGEARWLGRIEAALEGLPEEGGDLRRRLESTYGHLYDAASYGL